MNHVLEAEGIRALRPTWANTSSSWPDSGPSTSSPPRCTCRRPTWAGCCRKTRRTVQRRAPDLTAIARKHSRGILEAGHGHFRLQFRRGRHRHAGYGRERGQRRAVDRHAAGPRRPGGHRKNAAAAGLPARLPQYARPQRHGPETDHLHASDPRPDAGKNFTSFSSTTGGARC